jgi:hypothetical protein
MILRIEIVGSSKEKSAIDKAKQVLEGIDWLELIGEEVREISPFKKAIDRVFIDVKVDGYNGIR